MSTNIEIGAVMSAARVGQPDDQVASLEERMASAIANAISRSDQKFTALMGDIVHADDPAAMLEMQIKLADHGAELNLQSALASHMVKSMETLLKS